MLNAFVKYLLDFGQPQSREKDNGRVHPALNSFLLSIDKLDFSCDDDKVEMCGLHMVHPLENIIK